MNRIDNSDSLGEDPKIPIPTAENLTGKRSRFKSISSFDVANSQGAKIEDQVEETRSAPVIKEVLDGKRKKPEKGFKKDHKSFAKPNLRMINGGKSLPKNVPAEEMKAFEEAADIGAKMRETNRPEDADAEKPESPAPVRNIQKTTYKDALLILAQATQAKKKGKTFETRIAGMEITDPEKAFKSLQAAFKLVSMYLFKFLKIDPNKITFEQMEGKTAGLSTTQGIKLDPAMLDHEITELGGVVFHEILHQNDTLQNEGLIQAATDVKFGTFQVTQEYKDASNKMKDFARIFNKNGDFRQGVLDIYEACHKGLKNTKYLERLYKDFIKNTKGVFSSIEEANKYFQEIFPEYRVVKNKKINRVHSLPLDRSEEPPTALAA